MSTRVFTVFEIFAGILSVPAILMSEFHNSLSAGSKLIAIFSVVSLISYVVTM